MGKRAYGCEARVGEQFGAILICAWSLCDERVRPCERERPGQQRPRCRWGGRQPRADGVSICLKNEIPLDDSCRIARQPDQRRIVREKRRYHPFTSSAVAACVKRRDLRNTL